MAPVTNKELASKLRAMARSAKNENVRRILTESANRLEKPGHKQTPKKAAVLYSVWDNRTDKLIAIDLPGRIEAVEDRKAVRGRTGRVKVTGK